MSLPGNDDLLAGARGLSFKLMSRVCSQRRCPLISRGKGEGGRRRRVVQVCPGHPALVTKHELLCGEYFLTYNLAVLPYISVIYSLPYSFVKKVR